MDVPAEVTPSAPSGAQKAPGCTTTGRGFGDLVGRGAGRRLAVGRGFFVGATVRVVVRGATRWLVLALLGDVVVVDVLVAGTAAKGATVDAVVLGVVATTVPAS